MNGHKLEGHDGPPFVPYSKTVGGGGGGRSEVLGVMVVDGRRFTVTSGSGGGGKIFPKAPQKITFKERLWLWKLELINFLRGSWFKG